MLLDYVLEQRDVEWYATEDDKVAFFTSRFGVPLLDVPQRVYVAPRRDRGLHHDSLFHPEAPDFHQSELVVPSPSSGS